MNLRLVITLLKWPVLPKEMDPTRLVHYEGDFEAEVTDVYSTMYTWLEHPTRELLMNTIIENSKNRIFYVNIVMRWGMALGI